MEIIKLTPEQVKQSYQDNGISEKRIKNAENKLQNVPEKGIFASLGYEIFKTPEGQENKYPVFIVLNEEGKKIGTLSVGRIMDNYLELDQNQKPVPVQVKNENSKYFKKWFLKSVPVNKELISGKSELEVVSSLLGKSFGAKRLTDQLVQKITMADGVAMHFEDTATKAMKHVENKDVFQFTIN